MIKFPYELSKERQSLLSKEDKKIYEYEHSGLCPEMNKLIELNYDINLYNSLYENSESDNGVISAELFEDQFDELFDKELIDIVGIQEYNRIKKSLYEYILNDPELKPIYEAQGTDHTFWIPGLGWLGKLCGGLLTGLVGLLAWLFMKGMDRLAMKKLKEYMNKLVELTDQGVHKKKPWYAFLIPGSKNVGEYSKGCFRTIQETAERNMACLYTQVIQNLGFLSPSISNFSKITSGDTPPKNSGLGMFNDKANEITEELYGVKIDDSNKLLPFKPDKTKFENLKLPALPTNYKMLMSDIDYPDKSKKNPNGSLFMKPTEEILQEKGSDIGIQYFKNASLDGIINRQKASASNESMMYYNEAKRLNELLGGLFTTDLNNEVGGKEINQETLKKETTKINTFKGKLTEAIDNYVRSSIPIVNRLVKAVCGPSNAQALGKLSQLVTQLTNAAEGHMSDYMKKNDTVLKDIVTNSWERKDREAQNRIEILQHISNLMYWLGNGQFVKDALGNIDNTKLQDLKNKLSKLATQSDLTSDKEFNIELRNLFNRDWNYFKGIIDNYKNKNNNNTSDSYQFKYKRRYNINEDEQHLDDDAIKNSNEILDAMNKSMDTTYQNVRNKLSEELAGIIVNNPEEWFIIKDARERMNKLKDAADKEINAKIELICRTAASGNTDLGDKFKAAISKHPVRAESLKRIWAMYSDDLSDRINARIRSITGDNGNSNILTTIQQFLTNVYPNLMAILLYYKSLLYCVELYTRNHPIPEQVTQQQEEISETEQESIIDIWFNEVNAPNNNIPTPNNQQGNTTQPNQQSNNQQQANQQTTQA